MHRDKARCEIHKNPSWFLEQILKATPQKNSSCTATCLWSKRSFKLDLWSIAGEEWKNRKWCLLMHFGTLRQQCSLKCVDLFTSALEGNRHATKKICQEQWMIGTDSERESRKSVLSAGINDAHDHIYIYIYIYVCVCVCVCVHVYQPFHTCWKWLTVIYYLGRVRQV